MNRIREKLLPEQILLDAKATTQEEAVEKVASSYRATPESSTGHRLVNRLVQNIS